jgi:putative ABC transport system permease protein
MSWRRDLAKFGALFRRSKPMDDLAEEIRSHLEMEEQENLESGMPPEEAHYAALRRFGNVALAQERSREMWGWNSVETLWQDLRYGLRMLARNPGFTAVGVLTLALGIGANTAIFTVINAVLLQPLPYPDPGRVVWVTEFMPPSGRAVVLTPEYAAWGKVEKIFDQLGAYDITRGINLTGGAQPERIMAGHVTPSFFRVLEANPALGRTFLPEEGLPGHDRVAVVSHNLWQGYFNGDPNVLGKSLVLDGASYNVIGVMPRQFLHPGSSGEGVWLPFAVPPEAERPGRSMGFVSVIGRLKPGVGLEKAQSALEVVTRRMDNQYPPPWSRRHASAHVSLIPLHDWLTRDVRPALYVMLGAVGLVLLIACANVANLLLARAVSREKEIAVRAAIGAGRARLIRQMLTESTLLAVGGGGLGLLLVPLLTTILQAYVPGSLAAHAHVDFRVLASTLACCVLAGILFGLAPAFAASKLRLTESLKENTSHFGESKTHRRLRSGMVVVQLGLSVVLLVGAGLLLRSFLLLLQVNSGIDPHNVLTAEVWLPPGNIYDTSHQREFYRRVLERVRTIPGVEFAGATTEMPFTMFNALGNGLMAEGQPESNVPYCPGIVTANYFRAMGIRLLSGRFFDEHDAAGALPVVILDQSLAHALFPGQDAVGRRIMDDGTWRTVVGVVADTHHLGLSERVMPELFTSYLQEPSGFMDIVVRTSSEPLTYVPALRNAVLAVDKNQPLADVKTMEQRLSESLSTRRERLLLLGTFAILAVLIAASGVYGVTAYSVTRRTHEIGVRLALGASRVDIMRMMMLQGLRFILLGIAVGLAGAFVLSRTLATFLYHTAPTDPLTFATTSFLLGMIGCLAIYVPARRATKVDPMVALRYE